MENLHLGTNELLSIVRSNNGRKVPYNWFIKNKDNILKISEELSELGLIFTTSLWDLYIDKKPDNYEYRALIYKDNGLENLTEDGMILLKRGFVLESYNSLGDWEYNNEFLAIFKKY